MSTKKIDPCPLLIRGLTLTLSLSLFLAKEMAILRHDQVGRSITSSDASVLTNINQEKCIYLSNASTCNPYAHNYQKYRSNGNYKKLIFQFTFPMKGSTISKRLHSIGEGRHSNCSLCG